MRPGKSDDQHVLESLAIGVVAEISRWKLKMHAWRPVVPLWQGGGVCPVPEDDGASRHVAIDASAQTIGSAPSLRGRVDPVHCDGEAPTEVRPLGPFWHDGVVHPKPVPRDLIVAASKRTPAPGLRPGTIPGQQCRQGLYSWANDYTGGLRP